MEFTVILSVYAASLSTVVFIWNISRAIPRFKVDIVHAVVEIEEEFQSGVYVSIRNPSPHAVHLAGVSPVYKYGERTIFNIVKHLVKYRRSPITVGWVHTSLSNYKVDDNCPLTIESGRSHNIFVPESVINEIFEDSNEKLIRAEVQDQLWRSKYSKVFNYN